MPARIALYSDVHCPYACLTVYRLRQLREEFRGRVVIEYKSLALEYVNKRPTPKPILDIEAPVLLLEEPQIPYQPWYTAASEWPVTMWPAFEAIKCAERQSPDLASQLDWTIRAAFFGQSRCISMRHVLVDLVAEAGLDLGRFAEDFDGGVAKRQVLEEARDGRERLKVPGSPTLVLPSGKQIAAPGLPDVQLDEAQHYRLTAIRPAPCSGPACLDLLRRILAEAAS
jgi:predicted DsbA family dithiol-disulfide isomerase